MALGGALTAETVELPGRRLGWLAESWAFGSASSPSDRTVPLRSRGYIGAPGATNPTEPTGLHSSESLGVGVSVRALPGVIENAFTFSDRGSRERRDTLC